MSLEKDQLQKLENLRNRCVELENRMADNAVASDPEQMKKIGKEFSALERFRSLYDDYIAARSELDKLEHDS